jgi:hypothetical protein
MKRVKLFATAVALAVLAVLAGRVTAQQTNISERTFLTFSNAVEMPGITLQAGTYVFKLADSPTRNVVQVWDNDEKNMLGQWTFVQADRSRVTEDTVVMFKETREGSTPAVQYWYFPGERIGKEFIYPKDQAERIAARTGAAVRSEAGVVEGGGIAAVQEERSSEVAAAPSPEPAADAALRDAPAPAQPTAAAGSLAGNRQPAAEPEPAAEAKIEVAEAPAPAAPVVEESRVAANQADSAPRPVGTSGRAQQPAADELPRTASPLALSGLLGLMSLFGAAGIRVFRS